MLHALLKIKKEVVECNRMVLLCAYIHTGCVHAGEAMIKNTWQKVLYLLLPHCAAQHVPVVDHHEIHRGPKRIAVLTISLMGVWMVAHSCLDSVRNLFTSR